MFQSIDPKQLQENVFSLIGDQWTLITAGTPDHCNTMTASWGGMGVMWGKPVAVCGSVEERHGIVLAKNYAAKAFGVSTERQSGRQNRSARNL